MNGLSNLDETYREYSLAPIDDLIRFWRSKVNGQGHSRPWQRHARRRCDIKVDLLVIFYTFYAFMVVAYN